MREHHRVFAQRRAIDVALLFAAPVSECVRVHRYRNHACLRTGFDFLPQLFRSRLPRLEARVPMTRGQQPLECFVIVSRKPRHADHARCGAAGSGSPSFGTLLPPGKCHGDDCGNRGLRTAYASMSGGAGKMDHRSGPALTTASSHRKGMATRTRRPRPNGESSNSTEAPCHCAARCTMDKPRP